MVQLGKHRVRALVDTGATVSCISHALLNKLHPKSVQYFKSDITHISSVGGKKHEISDLVQVDFHVGDHRFTQKFYALHNPYSLILGMDSMRKYSAKLDFENSSIELNSNLFDLVPPPSRSTLVKLKEDTLIQAYTSQDVNVMMSRKTLLVFHLLNLSRLWLGNSRTWLWLMDWLAHMILCVDSDSAIVVPKGTVVALARCIAVNCVTEISDFIEPDDDDESDSENAVDNEISAWVSASDIPPDEAHSLKDNLMANRLRFMKPNLENLGDPVANTHNVSTGSFSANSRYYRAAPKMQREIDEQIHKLLKYGLIEPSLS